MNQAQAPAFSPRTNQITSLAARIMTGLGVVLGGMWAIITYLVPDPSVFGFGFINWRNIVLLVSVFTVLGALSLCWQIRNLPKMLHGATLTLLIAGLSFIFFILGTEYAKPTFEFAKVQSMVVENDGNNLLGKRMDVVDSVRVELVGCENIGRYPNCTFTLTNLEMDRDFRFESASRFFDESGAPVSIKELRVGQQPVSYWNSVQILRNVPTTVILVFQETDRKVEHSPSIKLIVSTRDNGTQALKFNDVTLK